MLNKRFSSLFLVIEIALILFVTTLTYLPNLRKATIYRDDWYYTVDRVKGGSETFFEMFKIDRPARGYLFEAYYRLFGVEPAPYHMATYALRLMLGLATFWLFSLLWPKQRQLALLITILFIIFPGYTRWMEGMEDQPKVVSLLLQVTSYALTLHAISARRLLPKIALWAGSILMGWGYLALIDYAMGMEAFRFLCVFAFINRDRSFRSLAQKGVAFVRAAWPGVFVLGGFLFWRVLIFNNERPETDMKLQISKVLESPVAGLTYWLTHFIQSILNSAIVSWGGYGIQPFFQLSDPQMLAGLLVSLTVTACVLLAFLWLHKNHQKEHGLTGAEAGVISWRVEAIGIGLLGTLAGVIPVVMANRAVEFGILSHYGLPVSLASATLLGGLIFSITSLNLRMTAIVVVVLLAQITQYTTSTIQANEEKILNNFWHQVAWRAPAIREATSVLANYPSVKIGEDVDFVHGPANFIYFPEPSEELPIRYKIFAIKQYDWTSKEYLAGGKVTDGYRTHYGVVDYGYILVMTQPTVNSCVHIIDNRWPWFSSNDLDTDLIVGQGSNIRNVRPNGESPKLSETIFGPEPAHEWCYYFEKADLAFQKNELETVVTLAKEADKFNDKPVETLEWMPFLQTYAMLGDETAFAGTLSKMNLTPFNQGQTCNVMTKMQAVGAPFKPAIQSIIKEKLCTQQAE